MSAPARPLVLAIETSCDDTACALVTGDGRVLASVVSSQIAAHRPYGGVVPEIASREHLANWPAVSAEAFARAGVGLDDVDVVAATRGPGLVGALLVGLTLGRTLAWARGREFHAVHHLEGHVFSPFLAELRFTDFRIEPYSALLGAVRNADRFHLYVELVARPETP